MRKGEWKAVRTHTHTHKERAAFFFFSKLSSFPHSTRDPTSTTFFFCFAARNFLSALSRGGGGEKEGGDKITLCFPIIFVLRTIYLCVYYYPFSFCHAQVTKGSSIPVVDKKWFFVPSCLRPLSPPPFTRQTDAYSTNKKGGEGRGGGISGQLCKGKSLRMVLTNWAHSHIERKEKKWPLGREEKRKLLASANHFIHVHPALFLSPL